MDWLRNVWVFIHTLTNPEALATMAGSMGWWLYALLFAIIFVETGLVVMPFLPGDSLLFAIGAIGAFDDTKVNLPLMGLLLILAAVLGDAVNYSVGLRLGPAVFRREDSRWLNKKHLLSAQAFYEKHGGKTIIIARFLPFIRTFAPFVAGIGRMSYPRFAIYNVTGAIAWICLFMGAGKLFGGISWVQKNIESMVIALIIIPGLPAVYKVVQAWIHTRRKPRHET
ncbi:MAG: VTT domain-containing protein [Holophagaceae bacterium]|nr:VTT domain-containing protein [Holophagaceae bacterium]